MRKLKDNVALQLKKPNIQLKRVPWDTRFEGEIRQLPVICRIGYLGASDEIPFAIKWLTNPKLDVEVGTHLKTCEAALEKLATYLGDSRPNRPSPFPTPCLLYRELDRHLSDGVVGEVLEIPCWALCD